MRTPEFNNVLRILDHQRPHRHTLFEFFLNAPLYRKLAAPQGPYDHDQKYGLGTPNPMVINAFANAGYDYATFHGCTIRFPAPDTDETKKTCSINSGLIYNRTSFNNYPWPDPDAFDYSGLARSANWLRPGMKLVIAGPGGVLENAIRIVGYETLCCMLCDDPRLLGDIFDRIGSTLCRYYQIVAAYDTVGALISNDDWGFKTQTMLSPDDMRRFVFPWHKRIAQTIHAAGKPAILHSCGNLHAVMDDIIESMKYDGKHSYEDTILSVEQAYDLYGSRIAILGGIDLDFICRSQPSEITARCNSILVKSSQKGCYALGSGNSIPDYVPYENYFAMTRCVLDA
jgi:uroporphyrinogen decarboxylase